MHSAGDRRTIGFVGLGNIGVPMATNLLRAQYDVLGFDPVMPDAFLAAGGRAATDVAEVARCCDAVVQSLPNEAALVASVNALLAHAAAGTVLIEISSYKPAVKRREADRLADAGITMLDCEVSGLPPQAAQRKAVIFKAGDRDAMARVTPVLDAMAENHFDLGPFGAATTMKLIANAMVCANNLLAAEALNLGRRAGLDPAQVVAVLGPSAAGSATFTNKAPLMLSREFGTGRGPFRHMFGYLSRAADLAQEVGARTPLLDRTCEIYRKAEAEGRHEQDIAAIIEVVEAQP
ncbi:NAD(P)-dependent oxidoreductase [Muricoccus aerilatus]|uniref:NAD(P)-dependent oxidoreductase n=1 Tax=Muricoccus aerilatus TaxID=452982 RepID=UPI0005C18307|nr:NAD(P)-dependent oxidoreductase [Roseomonas aerilata]